MIIYGYDGPNRFEIEIQGPAPQVLVYRSQAYLRHSLTGIYEKADSYYNADADHRLCGVIGISIHGYQLVCRKLAHGPDEYHDDIVRGEAFGF